MKVSLNIDFFYKKDKGSNENVENEINHHIYKKKRNIIIIYIYQILELSSIFLIYKLWPFKYINENVSTTKIIILSLLLGLNITMLIVTYSSMIYRIVVDSDEYDLLSTKRKCKGLIEVLQDYFYNSPSKVFKIKEKEINYKSWIDISGKFSMNLSEDSYLILFIKPHIIKYDIDGKLGNVNYLYDNYIHPYFLHKNYIKVGNKEPYCFHVNFFNFLFFIGLAGFYLYYVRCYIIVKEFTVKKIINEKDDLNTMKQNIEYDDKYTPGIFINGKEFLFDSNLTGRNIEIVQTETTTEIELNYKVKVNL